ncbi:TenA family protein [Blastococcus sp. SYSU DS0533]
MTGFCDRAWAATAELRRAIDGLPFLAELADGSLAPEAFRHYLEQDALYLGGYARALALLAARAPDAEAAAFWAGSAQNCGAVETQLHADLLGTDVLGEPDGAPVASPTCLAYTSYLVATAATAPYPVAAAAVLPCYWVYGHVGARLAPVVRAAAGHPYRRWIATYDAAPFQAATATARRLTDAAARSAPGQEGAMLTAFAVATRYELEFWRAAHARESWTVPV